jgi:hypothetical protein
MSIPNHYLKSNLSQPNNEKAAIWSMPHHYISSNISKPNNE